MLSVYIGNINNFVRFIISNIYTCGVLRLAVIAKTWNSCYIQVCTGKFEVYKYLANGMRKTCDDLQVPYLKRN